MNIRTLVALSGLVALGAAPIAAQAYGSNTAADACVQAFVDTYLPKDRAVKLRWLAPAGSPLGNYARRYTIDLSARVSRNGNEIVSARCVASAGGRVIELASRAVAPVGTEITAR